MLEIPLLCGVIYTYCMKKDLYPKLKVVPTVFTQSHRCSMALKIAVKHYSTPLPNVHGSICTYILLKRLFPIRFVHAEPQQITTNLCRCWELLIYSASILHIFMVSFDVPWPIVFCIHQILQTIQKAPQGHSFQASCGKRVDNRGPLFKIVP